jgi:hypothetical protein
VQPEILSGDPELKSDKLKDDLAAWLDNMHLEDGDGDGHGHGKGPDVVHTHPRISSNQVDLYRCSHCGNPSAALRKCTFLFSSFNSF